MTMKKMTATFVLLLGLGLALAGCKGAGKAPAHKKEAPPKKEALQENKPPEQEPVDLPHRLFSSAGEALEQVLKDTSPRVLGLGEFHQTKGTAKVRSATRRFTESMVPVLGPRASDLVVETWITEGKCGKQEKRVARGVARTTERPKHTESEIVTMLKRAKALGVRPHILKAGCDDYKGLLGKDGKVDYQRLLAFITRGLHNKAEAILKHRARKPQKGREVVVLYGGALHNDLYPYEDLKAFTYGEALKKRTKDRYVELDLYVPEYVQGDEILSKERWYPLFSSKASKEKVLLIQRGEASYILVLKRGVGL